MSEPIPFLDLPTQHAPLAEEMTQMFAHAVATGGFIARCFSFIGGTATLLYSSKFNDLATTDETFASLGVTFDIDAKVVKHMVDKNMKNLQDFRFWFTSKAEIGPFIQRVENADNALNLELQAARVRRALEAVRQPAARRGGHGRGCR